MRLLPIVLSAIGLIAPALRAAPVTASASFTGGFPSSSWSFQYLSGSPNIYLEQIKIDLSPGTDLSFDTSPAICCFAGTDVITGLTSYSPSGAALAGATEVVFNFNNFLPGDTFQFTGDVDHPAPTLLPLNDCSGKTGFALGLCQAANAIIIATNNARILAAETVLSTQIKGATVTFLFGGPGYNNTPVTSSFNTLTLGDILSGQTANTLDTTGQVIPEPSSVALFAAGMGLVALVARRRRRA
jgi:hypothetical protein